MKKLLAILLVLALALSLAACGGKKDDATDDNNTVADTNTDNGASNDEAVETFKVGILQYVTHDALDQAREGFLDGLEDAGYTEGANLEVDYQNAENDQNNMNTMSERLVNGECDLILAIATPAAQSVAAKTTDIPILFTAVTDPVAANLMDDANAPGGNITGTNDMNPIKEQIDLLVELVPDAKTVGILYTSNEDNSIVQATAAKEALEALDIAVVEQTVTSANDVQQATQSLVDKVDAIYIPTDNILAASMPIVGGVCEEAKIPVVPGEIGMTMSGGLATLGLNYYNLGFQTGQMAARILEGADPATTPVESLTQFDYAVNEDMANAIGIELPQWLLEEVGK